MKPLEQIPTATYRVQLNPGFTFHDAAAILPYLSGLGISHFYASPYLRARPGSLYGYDIIDHNSLNPEIGSPEDYEGFVSELHRHGMHQILDIVPNHVGVMGSDNAWWLDVLENGEASNYADFFDIDWDPIKDELQGKVLVPVLAEQYGNILEKGDLKLSFDSERGEFSIFYHQHRFPITPSEYPRILGFQIERLQEKLGPTHEDLLELHSIITAFGHLPHRRATAPEQRIERTREKEVQKRRLAALCARSREITEFIEVWSCPGPCPSLFAVERRMWLYVRLHACGDGSRKGRQARSLLSCGRRTPSSARSRRRSRPTPPSRSRAA